ncbi:MAG: hypothetical protein IJ814_06550 [Paludibacteraceae bacterium]|nr:hypothetical protein [Paludibacteraceae bacterium]
MKRFVSLLMACVGMAASLCAQTQRKADTQTAQWRYELQAAVGQAVEGATLVRVWTYSTKPNIAEGQAGKNAVHGIIFKGFPASNDGTRIVGRDPLINDPDTEQKYQDYFTEFFKTGGAYQRYVSYIGNGVPDQILKVGKEYKVAVTVVVLIDQLRKRLEEDGILKPMDQIQGKMPTIMVVPAAAWCHRNGFTQTFDNQGVTEEVPDYNKALLSSTDLTVAINTINARMTKRGFPIKDLEAALKTLKSESAEDAMITSKSGDAIAETPIDILRRTAKADIWIEIDWYTTQEKGGSVTRLTYSMRAIDAYTDFVVAGVPPTTGQAVYTSSFQLPIMMESAIQGQFDPFCNTMQDYFTKLAQQGRPIKMRILSWDSFEDGLMTELDGDELHEIITDWVADNTVNSKFGAVDLSPSGNRMTIEQVHIPLTNEKGRDLDARAWARPLQKMLRNKYNIDSNLSAKGLGQIQLIIGDK